MRDLSQERVWTYHEDQPNGRWGMFRLRRSKGTLVESYKDLVTKVAAVQFHNPNYVLLFRGQTQDYRLDDSPNRNSTIRPSIFRRDEGYGVSHWNRIIKERYDTLAKAEKLLVQNWRQIQSGDRSSLRRLERSPVIRWAILQHYEVCDTPLLDVTHSLRIAASFASLVRGTNEAFVMVLAVPQISGAVSACAHNEMQVLRLSSLCPPSAIRPHIQEGYLLGEYPELRTYGDKTNLRLHETDFGQRLIAKFRFNPGTFWRDRAFPKFPRTALSLDGENDTDELLPLCSDIRENISQEFI